MKGTTHKKQRTISSDIPTANKTVSKLGSFSMNGAKQKCKSEIEETLYTGGKKSACQLNDF